MSSTGGLKAYHLLIAGGAAAAVGGLVWYLLKDDKEEVAEKEAKDPEKKLTVDTATKGQVVEILNEILKSQEKMKGIMKELTTSMVKANVAFEEAYQRVKNVQPSDPLERYGLSMTDFDQLLDRYQNDPAVRESIAQIMGAGGPAGTSGPISQKAHSLQKDVIIKVHQFMLQELRSIVEQFQKLGNKSSYDMRTVTIAAQALVGAKVEEKFNLTSEDIEGAVLLNHAQLAVDPEFGRINVQMQDTMTHLMGMDGVGGFGGFF
ncbi:unnamed protein product [Vitrella brassicaformis CCMP3155]|uniref:Uncharacterized protein n=1 Tax=Vitrella brassicaformis (strain CCMP3155) TaxID=1169540 RepID=A0A0G4GQE9_VITBC|nr:unnamed protein product [Vitrella brassicaformis CCMP3155]|mmetsp:Transcript_42212/g.105416  ORF Transcript_42212/g.105416 Transcript_42212/m.105416 type:complete len:262 (-) Transcript_42212:895-1680(-)|eukprot:CEM32678.1 unnamed protein product [Vitrella brassicaformis CCMP3155]